MRVCKHCFLEREEERFWYQEMLWPWCDTCRLELRGAPYPIHDRRCHGCGEYKCKEAYLLIGRGKRGDLCYECRFQLRKVRIYTNFDRPAPVSRSKFLET